MRRWLRETSRAPAMAIYYFDLRDGDETVPDEEGLELQDLLAVQKEAARALASLS